MAFRSEDLVLVADLRAAGLSTRDISTRVEPLRRVAVGAYTGMVPYSPEQDHLARAAGALSRVGGALCSHVTAAVQLDLPTPNSYLSDVHLSPKAGRRGNPKHGPGYRFHCLPVDDAEIHTGAELPATSAIRTVVDCGRLLDVDWGVAIADAALHRGLVTGDALAERCGRVIRLSGSAKVRRLPHLASPLAESPGESLLRMRLLRMDLEVDEQVVLDEVSGRPRVDFVIRGTRLVIEFDGESKYVIDGDPARAHWLEKQRHDRIVEAGYVVIHVTWAQLWDEPALRFRVNRARRRALQLPA